MLLGSKKENREGSHRWEEKKLRGENMIKELNYKSRSQIIRHPLRDPGFRGSLLREEK